MAVYLINRTYTSTHGKTPIEKISNEKVDISDLKLFGCPVMVHVPKENHKKLDEKTVKMVFVGYDSETKGYRCINKSNRKLTVSRDVKFLDHSMQPAQKYAYVSDESDDEEIDDAQDDFCTPNTTSTPRASNESSINTPSTPNVPNAVGTSGGHNNIGNNNADENNAIDSDDEVSEENRHNDELDEDTLVEENEVTTSNADDSEYIPETALPAGRRSMINTRSRSVSQLNLNSHYALFIEPTTVTEALKSTESESWKKAMEDEMQSLKSNHTWELVPLPKDRKAIKCKWVFKVKRDASGQISKYKARLVAKGFSQRPSIYFDETFSPVVRYDSTCSCCNKWIHNRSDGRSHHISTRRFI